VTVIGDNGVLIDPLTTALFIVGPEKGLALVKKLGCEAIFVDAKGRIVTTDGIRMTR
jgi:thiamine biosynthesis lipoprotein